MLFRSEEGMVPGGGVALLRAACVVNNDLKRLGKMGQDQAAGAKIILSAAEAPIRQMAVNAGESPDLIVKLVKEQENKSAGYNFITSEIADMIKSGIIDPTKVSRVALQNAVSVASTLITSGCAIIET